MAIKSADQITLVDVTDAYSVILTSEAYTFVGGTSGATSGTCNTQVAAFRGSNQRKAVVDEAKIECPAGISAAVTGTDGNTPTITFTIDNGAVISTACEANIPVTVDDSVTVNKKFSFAVAKAGANGSDGTSVTVTSTSVTYQASSSGTTTPTGSWSDTVPSVPNGQYLWTKTYVKYSDGNETTSYSVSYKGTNGANGTSVTVSSKSVTYQASSSGTTTPTGSWSTTVPTVTKGQFLWTKTYVKYSDGNETTSYSVSYMGTNGTDGADAITITITSSAGTVFKNSSGSTVLTAHVYQGGVEKTVAANGTVAGLGTIKWYKGSSTTAITPTSNQITVQASDVFNTVAYTCQLEG